jgi:hypothetical protein
MPESNISDNSFIKQRFGGGLNTRASENEIDKRESADGGINYELDPINLNLKPRKPFDLLDTTPDGYEIRGMINLVKTDGTTKIAVQTAGGNVYEYQNAASGFNATPVATGLSSSAKLRGRIEHNWALSDKVIITDLNLQEHVIEWDGTTFQDVTFSPSGTALKAKYANVSRERLWLANIDTGSATPHIMAASTVSDYTTIDVNNKPSSALGADDPFYVVSPDLRPINGLVQEFSQVFFSTEDGAMHILQGEDSTDFNIDTFFSRSYASGDEAMISIGNMIMYGRRGRVEFLRDTDRFADSEANDFSLKIQDDIETYKDWTVVYNNRTQKAYCFPSGVSACYVASLPMIPTGFSPWMKYTTTNALAFQPTCVMNMIDPEDGLEYVFMGDGSGNFYRMEGTFSGGGDAGADEVKSVFVSRVQGEDPDMSMQDFTGYVRYKKSEAFDVNLSIVYSGKTALEELAEIQIPAGVAGAIYGGSKYYGDGEYYGKTFQGRLLRQDFSVAGAGEDIQIKVEITSDKNWQLNEVALRFSSSNV